jgi:hypothetical protein
VEKSRIKEFEDYVKHKVEKEKSKLYKIVRRRLLETRSSSARGPSGKSKPVGCFV